MWIRWMVNEFGNGSVFEIEKWRFKWLREGFLRRRRRRRYGEEVKEKGENEREKCVWIERLGFWRVGPTSVQIRWRASPTMTGWALFKTTGVTKDDGLGVIHNDGHHERWRPRCQHKDGCHERWPSVWMTGVIGYDGQTVVDLLDTFERLKLIEKHPT